MRTIYDQRFAILEYLRDVKVASVSHPQTVFPEFLNNILLTFLLCFITFAEILHHLLYHACLQDVGYIHSFSELCHKRWFADTFCAAHDDDEGNSLLVELRDELIPLNKSFAVVELCELQEEDVLELALGDLVLVWLNEMLLDIECDFDRVFLVYSN